MYFKEIKYTMSSINSAMSSMSVSYMGKEVCFEEAIDDIFKQLQTHLNNTHCEVRQLAMLGDQDDDFKVACEYSDGILDNVDGMTTLFKELRSITLQVRGKCPKEDSEWFKEHEKTRKQVKAIEKKEAKCSKINE